jgi:hypothetical protein
MASLDCCAGLSSEYKALSCRREFCELLPVADQLFSELTGMVPDGENGQGICAAYSRFSVAIIRLETAGAEGDKAVGQVCPFFLSAVLLRSLLDVVKFVCLLVAQGGRQVRFEFSTLKFERSENMLITLDRIRIALGELEQSLDCDLSSWVGSHRLLLEGGQYRHWMECSSSKLERITILCETVYITIGFVFQFPCL